MAVQKVKIAIGVLTVSIIVIVIVTSGYMDEAAASVFDEWWKPFAIGAGLSMIPLLGMIAIENKAHEKLVGLLARQSDPMGGIRFQGVKDDGNEGGDESLEQIIANLPSLEELDLNKRLKDLGNLKVPKQLPDGEVDGEEELDYSGVGKAKAALEKFTDDIEKGLASDLDKIERDRVKAQENIEEEIASIEDEKRQAEEDLQDELERLDEEYDEKIKGVKDAQSKFAKELEEIEKANKVAQTATKDFGVEGMKKSQGSIFASDLDAAVEAFRRSKGGRGNPLQGGKSFDDAKKYRDAMIEFSKKLQDYVRDYRTAYKEAEGKERDRLKLESTRTDTEISTTAKAVKWFDGIKDPEEKERLFQKYRQAREKVNGKIDVATKYEAYTGEKRAQGGLFQDVTVTDTDYIDQKMKEWKFKWDKPPPKEPQFQPKGPPPNAGESVEDVQDELDQKKQEARDRFDKKTSDLDKKAKSLNKKSKQIDKKAAKDKDNASKKATRAKNEAERRANAVRPVEIPDSAKQVTA